jgi:prolyl-tRNA editing enzyme YbaK/EbsC (Cys-tRNA(Pro) deacylase)
MTRLGKSAARVQAFLNTQGLLHSVMELPDSTRTAQEAADSIGCQVAQIAKTVVFRDLDGNEPVIVVASGVNRVDVAKIEACTGLRLVKADADFIRSQTGFVIGGVPPAGHDRVIRSLLDHDLQAFTELWAAAGTPHAVFRLTPNDLEKLTGGQWLDIRLL